jgi:hypothetical protein
MSLDRSRLPGPVEYFEGEVPKLIGKGTWRSMACAFCGARQAMRVNTESGGWCCMSCFAKGGDVCSYQEQRYSTGLRREFLLAVAPFVADDIETCQS